MAERFDPPGVKTFQLIPDELTRQEISVLTSLFLLKRMKTFKRLQLFQGTRVLSKIIYFVCRVVNQVPQSRLQQNTGRLRSKRPLFNSAAVKSCFKPAVCF